MSPGIRGIGIDPSCRPISDRNVTLIRDTFNDRYFNHRNIRLVILRHVLEHIHKPVHFLSALRAAIGEAPLFVEVPDLDWILTHGVFWDFCYEHCNYFTLDTLRFALSMASFEVLEQQRTFADQYQWSICRSAAKVIRPTVDARIRLRRGLTYAETETSRLKEIKRIAKQKGGIVLWGMATKGVILSNLMSPELLRGGVDLNVAKQGRYAPMSGLEIHAPSWLRNPEAGSVVLVMNPNYRDEISDILQTEKLEPELLFAMRNILLVVKSQESRRKTSLPLNFCPDRGLTNTRSKSRRTIDPERALAAAAQRTTSRRNITRHRKEPWRQCRAPHQEGPTFMSPQEVHAYSSSITGRRSFTTLSF